LTVTADDGNGGTIGQTFSVIVAEDNDAPVITAYVPVELELFETIDSLSTTVNLAFELTAEDVDDLTLTYNWYIDGNLESSSVNNTFDYDFAIGTYEVLGEVSDGELTDTVTWNVTVYSTVGNLEDSEITVNNIDIDLGESGTVTVSTTPLVVAWDVISYNFTLGFDSALVDYTGYELTGTVSDGAVVNVVDNGNNIEVSATSGVPWEVGGALIKLVF